MSKVHFRDLPVVIRVASAIGVLAGWACFEEFGIDRNHWDRFLPLYRIGQFCPYDAAMILFIATVWIVLSLPPRATKLRAAS
jgi:hypothetical protein